MTRRDCVHYKNVSDYISVCDGEVIYSCNGCERYENRKMAIAKAEHIPMVGRWVDYYEGSDLYIGNRWVASTEHKHGGWSIDMYGVPSQNCNTREEAKSVIEGWFVEDGI